MWYLKLEWLKLKHLRYVKVMLILWLVAFLAIPIAANYFLDWLSSQGETLENFFDIRPDQLPIFDFVDIWQNLAYVYKFLTIFLMLIVVISVTTEWEEKTFRQNVIDGLTRKEFFYSKIGFIVVLSLVSTTLLFLLGLFTGMALSPVTEFKYIVKNIDFLLAYFLHLVYHLSLGMLAAMLIRRTGLTIILLLFWMYIFEPIAGSIINYGLDLPWLANSLPFEVSWGLVPIPFGRYILQPTVSAVDYLYVVKSMIYIGVIWISTGYLLIVKDIK